MLWKNQTLLSAWCRSDLPFSDKAAIGLARLEKACDPTASDGAVGGDVEPMDSSDNEVRHSSDVRK